MRELEAAKDQGSSRLQTSPMHRLHYTTNSNKIKSRYRTPTRQTWNIIVSLFPEYWSGTYVIIFQALTNKMQSDPSHKIKRAKFSKSNRFFCTTVLRTKVSHQKTIQGIRHNNDHKNNCTAGIFNKKFPSFYSAIIAASSTTQGCWYKAHDLEPVHSFLAVLSRRRSLIFLRRRPLRKSGSCRERSCLTLPLRIGSFRFSR